MNNQLQGSLQFLMWLGVAALATSLAGGGWAPMTAWIVAAPVVIWCANVLDRLG